MSLAEDTGREQGLLQTSGEHVDIFQQREKRLGRHSGSPPHMSVFISLVGRINYVLNINEECPCLISKI